MELEEDEDATQQATQQALDPRRLGQQNSGFSDDEIADIICVLYPNSEPARREVSRLALDPKTAHLTIGRQHADGIGSDLLLEDDPLHFGATRGIGDHALILKLSARTIDPKRGHTFGRNPKSSDICFPDDPNRRLSNIHFQIFVNEHGTVMLQDTSTNGTVVDQELLRSKPKPGTPKRDLRLLESGSSIKIIMAHPPADFVFLVRIPRREGHLELTYKNNLAAYWAKRGVLRDEDVNKTIGPGPNGHVDLFPKPFPKGFQTRDAENDTASLTVSSSTAMQSRDWKGDATYQRHDSIGQGAFATVYRATNRWDGAVYAAKVLDKKRFVKNGVLDQKVENEMKIMKSISHEHIIKFIEHFEWADTWFIIMMEFVPGGDLHKIVSKNGSIREPYVQIMADQLTGALGYLHNKNITHRDVKPDNILVKTREPLVVKLTDFGLSKMIDTNETFLKTFCGTLLYCAPEVYTEYSSYDEQGNMTRRKKQRGADKKRYDHAVDIWSLGGVLFFALTASPPFPVKNGTSYLALLQHIMNDPLNINPLLSNNVSTEGIHFLRRMINVRPETRATIPELLAHPWLVRLSDEMLGKSASQLSICEERGASAYQDSREGQVTENDSMGEPEPDISSMEYELDENATQSPPKKLFGEVGNSGLGSSGVIGENQMNLPLSHDSEATDILDPVVHDSFDESENLSTPKQNLAGRGSNQATHGAGDPSVLFVESSGSFGDSAVLGLVPGTEARRESGGSDLNTSKRKPAYDTSDEFEAADNSVTPSFKRLKSESDANGAFIDEEECALLASVPPVVNNESGRRIDYPLHKTTYWDGSDRDTWHLDYPEMTTLQHEAFERAAKTRHEEFAPGKSPLWELAMKHFPPYVNQQVDLTKPLELRPTLKRDQATLAEVQDVEPPPTAPFSPNQLAPTPVPVHSANASLAIPPQKLNPNKVVARLTSPRDSQIAGVTLEIRDPVMSWGRNPQNTNVYLPSTESMVPKNAFRILVWQENYTASSSEFRPWDRSRADAGLTFKGPPDPKTFSFYISTKASVGIRINSNPLQSNLPQDPSAPSKYWMKLHHGDTILYWGSPDGPPQAKFKFECFWGSSSAARPADEPPTCVPATIARQLDRLWPKACSGLHYEIIKWRAQAEHEMRTNNKPKEVARTRMFEQKCAEAVRYMNQRASRAKSADSGLQLRQHEPHTSRPTAHTE